MPLTLLRPVIEGRGPPPTFAMGLMAPGPMRAMRSATPPDTLPTVARRKGSYLGFSSAAGAAAASASAGVAAGAAATGVGAAAGAGSLGEDRGSLPSGDLPAAPLMLPRGVLSAGGTGDSRAVEAKLGERECSLLRSPVCTPYMGEGCTVSELRRELDCDPVLPGMPEMLFSRDLRAISDSCSCCGLLQRAHTDLTMAPGVKFVQPVRFAGDLSALKFVLGVER